MERKEYYDNLGRIIIPHKEITAKAGELAAAISRDYRGRELILLGNLKGGFRFLADLVSFLDIPVLIDFVSFRSYSGTASSGKVEMVQDMTIDAEGRDILIIEDIVDGGTTLDFLIRHLKDKGIDPERIRVCSLLDKPSKRKIKVPVHYKGFEVPDVFIVGYGIDLDERFRELNDIREYKG